MFLPAIKSAAYLKYATGRHGDAVCTAWTLESIRNGDYAYGVMWVRVDNEWVKTFNTATEIGTRMFADDRRGVELMDGGGI